jgi:tetratricopeptide (TPR) repeat protein
MERKRYILILVLLTFIMASADTSYKSEVYKAYISNNMLSWKKVVDMMEKRSSRSDEFNLELLNYQYGYIGYCMGKKKYDEADHYLGKALKNLEELERKKFNLTMVYAYKSALTGYRIGLNKFQAPFLGPSSIEYAKESIRLSDKNPYGYIQLGNAEFYMPALFGGSKTRAIEYFKKAEKLMEQNPQSLKGDWNYLGLLAIIGQSYAIMERKEEAEKYYQKALKVEPAFLWVKNELYPALKN